MEWTVDRPVAVLYVDGEMPAPAMQARLDAVIKSTGVETQPGMLRLVSRDLQRLNDMPNIAAAEGQRTISDHMGDARVIILDNLSSLIHGTKENEAEGWEPVAQWAIRERSKGRSIIFIHHAGKGGGQRGTSKREDLLDVVIKLQRPSDYRPQDGARFEVHFEKSRSLFGGAVAPFEAKLQTGDGGALRWLVSGAEDHGELLALQAQGLSLQKIADRLGVDKSTVSRRLTQLRQAA